MEELSQTNLPDVPLLRVLKFVEPGDLISLYFVDRKLNDLVKEFCVKNLVFVSDYEYERRHLPRVGYRRKSVNYSNYQDALPFTMQSILTAGLLNVSGLESLEIQLKLTDDGQLQVSLNELSQLKSLTRLKLQVDAGAYNAEDRIELPNLEMLSLSLSDEHGFLDDSIHDLFFDLPNLVQLELRDTIPGVTFVHPTVACRLANRAKFSALELYPDERHA